MLNTIYTCFNSPLHSFGAMAVSLNWRIFSFALGLATLTSLAFAFVPAWRTSRVDLNSSLKAGAGIAPRA